jgi:hypothetical protein
LWIRTLISICAFNFCCIFDFTYCGISTFGFDFCGSVTMASSITSLFLCYLLCAVLFNPFGFNSASLFQRSAVVFGIK